MFKKTVGKITLCGIIITIITALFFWESGFAEVPQQMFFQAKLSKRDGTTVSGSHSAVFRLYSASSGGSSLWSETQTITADASGVISCYLGSSTALPSTIDYNSTYYLSIEVDSDGEMSPRIKIVPSLAALNSDRFDGLNSTQFLRSDTADTMEATLTFSGAATDIATASGEHFAIIPGGSGNVGIGTTAPQALLHVGTAPSSGLLVFASGNVGIGTTSATGSLDVRGDEVNIWTGAGTNTNATSSGELYVEGDLEVDGTIYGNLSSNTGTLSSLVVTGQSDLRGDVLDTTGNLTLNDSVDLTGALTQSGGNTTFSGNVGIGTTSPQALLHAGTAPSSGLFVFSSGNVGIGTTSPQALLHAGTAPSSGLLVFASGNVGIGTTSATGRLDVRGDEVNIWTGAGTNTNATSSGELYVEGDLEVDGTLYGNLSASTGSSTFAQLTVTGNTYLATTSGSVGIGTTAPTAYLHLKAGTATANTAPLKFTSGTNLTTAEAGAMEWDGTNLYISQTTGPTRKTLAFTDSNITGTAANVTGTVAVANGGTGATSFTSNGVLYGNSTSAIQVTGQGGANTVLTANAGAPSFSASPTIGTSVTTPLIIGGTGTTSTLTLKTTTGVGTTGADMILQVGNNGATEAMRILNNGNVGIGTTNPQYKLEVGGTVGLKSDGTNTAGLKVGYTGTSPAGYYATYAP